jgi:hypothetical protein
MSHTRPVQDHPEWEVRTLGARAFIYRAGVYTGHYEGDIYSAGALARELAAREAPPPDDYAV